MSTEQIERIDLPNTYPIEPTESADAWTDRLLHMARIHGTYRQCSIGWHGECSQRDQGAEAECLCICHDPADVRSPEHVNPGTKRVEISWTTTETFTATVEVDEDFELENLDADEVLDGIICDMDEAELGAAFQGCTDREITSKKEVTQ